MNRTVDRVARRQNSLITTAQMAEAGLSRNQVMRRCRQGAIERLRRGVYRLAGAPLTWTQTVHAAVLAAAAGTVASHGTAARLWGFRYSDRFTEGIHLTARFTVRLPGVVPHTAALAPGDTTEHLFVPVTTPERTFLDLAALLPLRELGECLDDALRRGLISLERLRRLVTKASERGGRRLLKPLRRLLGERTPDYRPGANDWERDMDRLWDALGLSPGVRQFRVTIGGKTFVIDRALPDLKIGAEYHGHEHHHRRSDRDRDAQRSALLSAAGWHILTFTSGTRPETLRDAVRRVVADRQGWMAAGA